MASIRDVPAATDQVAVRTYYWLRLLLAIVAIALPFAVVALDLIVPRLMPGAPPGGSAVFHINTSISAYYFTEARNVLIGALCAIGVFLIAYTGNSWQDDWLCYLAGIGGLLVGFFPTALGNGSTPGWFVENLGLSSAYSDHVRQWGGDGADWIGGVHLVGGILLFGSIGILSLCYFTRVRPEDDDGPQKRRRNRLYRWCGWVIFGAVSVMAVSAFLRRIGFAAVDDFVTGIGGYFIAETVAIWAFALAWLVASKSRVWLGGGKEAFGGIDSEQEDFNKGAGPCRFCRWVDSGLTWVRGVLRRLGLPV